MEMELQKVHLIRLEKDEELLTSILEYVKKKNILAGYLTGIGALGKGKIGYFDIKSKKYLHIPFKEVELLACTGNIAKNKVTQESRNTILELYDSWGKPEKAAEFESLQK